MKVAILGSGGGWHVDALTRACGARGHAVRLLPIQALAARIGGAPRLAAGGESLDEFDAILVRIIPRGSLEQVIFRVDALHWLKERGVAVVNSAGRHRAHGRQVLHVCPSRAGGPEDAAHRGRGARSTWPWRPSRRWAT